MLTQSAPPQQFRPFGQAGTAMPGGAQMMAAPRIPPPNMYPPGFNQFKQINIPPPNMLPPSSMGTDMGQQIVPGLPAAFPTSQQMIDFDQRRQQRRNLQRRTVDYNASIVEEIKNRIWKKTSTAVPFIQPDVLYFSDLASARSLIDNPVNSVTTRFVRTATNKIRCPLFTLSWTPEGRRLITGSSSGEFTLWGGLTFNFETVLQAHESAVRAMEWSHNDTWLLSADHSGLVKYWQSNMNNVKTIQAHNDAIRGACFAPTDNKFATCSDDGTVKIWDFYRCFEERVLRGHGADVKCVDWHPSKGLLVSGSKDSQQPLKLWDPKSGASLSTIHIHKSTVMDLQWNMNGNWLLTASRDHLIKVFDIRAMKEIQTFRGHKKEATAVDWHPVHESLFASGGSDGAIMFWNMGSTKELGAMDHAHDAMIWAVKWHPLGHILASGSNDHTCKFWTRNRPGDKMKDKFNLNTNPLGDDDYEYDVPTSITESSQSLTTTTTSIKEESLPGLSLTNSSPSASNVPISKIPEGIPGIDLTFSSPEQSVSDSHSTYSQLQSIRPSAFKLPNVQQKSNTKVEAKVTSTFKMPNAEEVREILEGRPTGKSRAGSVSGRGLLPTPSKELMLDVAINVSTNRFDVEPGMVIDAEEVWLDEKMIMMHEERLTGDNQMRKRNKKPGYQFQEKESMGGSHEGGPFFEEEMGERVGNSGRGSFDEDRGLIERDPGHGGPNWREPPEKKRLLQGGQMFNSGHSGPMEDERRDVRPPFPTNRVRPSHVSNMNVPFENRPIRDDLIQHEDNLFYPQQQHLESQPNKSPMSDGPWSEQESNIHPGMPQGRGRRRGSMHRSNPNFNRAEPLKSPSSFHDVAQPSLSWRERQSDENNHGNTTPTSQGPPGGNDRDNDNFMPGQRRGPHPLLKRGRGARKFGGRRPASFEGRGEMTPPGNERTNEGLLSPNLRERPKLRGLMDDINLTFPNENQNWQRENNTNAS